MDSEFNEQVPQQQFGPPEQEATFAGEPVAGPNLVLGIVAGLVAAVIGAAVWAVITVATEFQIGWMAVGVGFLVGVAVRFFGKGSTTVFGVVGAACALFGCILGNVLSECGFASLQEDMSFWEAVRIVINDPSIIGDILTVGFNHMDVLLYALAVYEGYRFSICGESK